MDEDAFRAFLTPRLSPRSVGSYLSHARRIERALAVDLDKIELTETGLSNLRARLVETPLGGDPKSLANYLTIARTYVRFRQAPHESVTIAPPRRLRRTPAPTPSTFSTTHPAFVRDAGVRDLLVLHGQVTEELREHGVVRTGNGPVGDYAEHLFTREFGWTLEANSSSGHDATTAEGLRIQIKSRRVTARNGSRQLGAIRRLPDQTFDLLAGVLFEEDYSVLGAALIPHAVVVSLARRVEHTNSWRFLLDDRIWSVPGVEDATRRLRIAQSTMEGRRFAPRPE